MIASEHLRVPLQACHERRNAVLHRLNHAIGRPAGHPQTRCHHIDGLVVQ
jgi:hypothetical protein